MESYEIENKFWDNVLRTCGCLLWIGAKTATGYGIFRWGHRERMKAHRYSFLLHNGDLQDKFVLHKCNNRLCVNPTHLYLGDSKDNVRDMINSKHQNNQSKTHCPQGHDYSVSNTYLHKNGSRRCKICSSNFYKQKQKGIKVWEQ